MNDFRTLADDADRHANRIYGKFSGIVSSNTDPDRRGRLQAFVPELLGEVPTGWAKPCTPYAGPTSGFFSLPPVGAGVWIEFEAGDVSRPIWSGGYWGMGETPMAPPSRPADWTTKIWRSELGLSAVLDDTAQTITLTDAVGANSIVMSVATGTITITGAARIVNAAGTLLQEGSASAAHPGVLGDQLMSYLSLLVALFNAHVHPGELAGGVLAVTPALPVPPFPPPSPSLISKKVMLE